MSVEDATYLLTSAASVITLTVLRKKNEPVKRKKSLDKIPGETAGLFRPLWPSFGDGEEGGVGLVWPSLGEGKGMLSLVRFNRCDSPPSWVGVWLWFSNPAAPGRDTGGRSGHAIAGQG